MTSFGRASIFAKTEKKSKGDHAIYDTKKIKALIAHVSKRVVSPINQWDGYKLGAIIKNFESIQIAYHKNVQEKRGTKTGFVPSGKELCHLAVESPWRCLKHILARSPVYVDWIIKQDNQELHNLVKYFRYSVENLKDLDFSNGDLKLGVAVGYSNIPVK